MSVRVNSTYIVGIRFDPFQYAVEVIIHGSNTTSDAEPSKIHFKHGRTVCMRLSYSPIIWA